MIKTYVIDSSVIIQSPDALTRFQDNVVVVPFVVLEKLGALSAVTSEQGINARKAIQMLEVFRLRGDLLQGVSLESGGILRVEKNYIDVALPKELPAESSDNRILKVCKGYQEVPDSQKPVILVTKSITLRLKAQMLGILAEDYTAEQVTDWASPYTGRMEVYVPEEQFKDFKKKGIPLKTVYTVDGNGIVQKPELFENQFVILRADQSAKKTLLGRVEKDKILPLKYKKIRPYGVNPQNVGQYFLQEALMQPASKAPLVIVKGMAGTAKTFYSLAVGLEKLINNPSGEYRKMIVCRPNSQFDSDIGFLPGDEQDKIYPLMRPIVDNLEQLIDSNIEKRYENEQELNDKIEEIFDRGLIQTEALNFIRGRSIVKTYLIIDEAQNMTPNQMKGIITRAGEGTKIILLGDPAQIDRPLLDEKTNGLSYASQYMKGSPLCWQITLTAEECERSALAMDALKRL
ncbi:PhoH family protein [Blautia hydrogenotrophica]|uniref:PhoH family protein n=1 Tax=Blautia hydrogenotrophica TaxID=53443 RepID=UPI002E79C2E0|nr:PhoH family protein [Blautia hydrogenotrophica]MEE0462665.1 PhoH family protein [Blautia hydrogenotrophica]